MVINTENNENGDMLGACIMWIETLFLKQTPLEIFSMII